MVHVVCYGVGNFDFVKPCRLSISTVYFFTGKIYISYYTSFRAIRENIARVRGCIFTSPKDE